jgi:hypothetical protein
MKTIKYILLLTLVSTLLFSCTDDDDNSVTPGTGINPNEEELITDVHVLLMDTFNTPLDTFRFSDPDGLGGNAPEIDTIRLSSNSWYNVSLLFLDASNPNDIDNITEEIKQEDDEHLICFDVINTSGLSIQRSDSDGTYEVGLESRWFSGGTQLNGGSVKLTLRHQPGGKDGTCNPGDTDVEVTFPVKVN